MKKNLISCFKKENVGFVILILVMALSLGCGKDDKNVTSIIPPINIEVGVGDKSEYLNAIPLNLAVTNAVGLNVVTWDVPSGFASDTTLVSYKIEVESPDSSTFFIVPASVTAVADTSNVTTGHTYTYTVISVFTLYDTTYEFYTEVESKPTYPVVVEGL